jgi:DNA-binding transcriptional regulator LsrR (DeoR family)
VASTSVTALNGGDSERLRLATKIASLYYVHNLTQAEIASRLHVSQSRVSRLLKFVNELGVVRTTVLPPSGVYPELEDALQAAYGIHEVVIVDVTGDVEEVTPTLGAAAAVYLEATLTGGDTVGISSWSASLLSAVQVMHPFRSPVVDTVVQIVGGIGDPAVQMRASQLIGSFATSTGAEAVFMPTPGMLGSAHARAALSADTSVTDVVALWERLTLVLVGIGSLDPSPLLRESGNALSRTDQQLLLDSGAVGDICLRFYDDRGSLVQSAVDDRVMGIDSQTLRRVPRRVGVAGGREKHASIRAALRGKWLTVLVTDIETASYLAESSSPDRARA